jgi:hypothetical protein
MFYPGQPIFIPSEGTIGLFIGEDERVNNTDKPFSIQHTPHSKTDYEVLIFNPETAEKTATTVFEIDDIKPLIKPGAANLTGKSVYYGPKDKEVKNRYIYRKPHWNSVISNDELKENKAKYAKFLEELAAEDWVLEGYLLPANKETT